ncbi:cytochrome c peroxidase [soil metagenome]
MNRISCLLTAISVLLISSCNKKSDVVITPVTLQLPSTLFNYSGVVFPAHIANFLPPVDNTPLDNAITNSGATLGRVLFYDTHLSKNNTISCASCHKSENSFSDAAQFSKGFVGGLTSRASISIMNERFYKSGKMFWDERAATLEEQVLIPIQNSVEMGMTLNELVTTVSSQSYYPALFESAFGSGEVTTTKISKALSQFIRSMVTFQSKYDRVKQGLEIFSTDEAAGEQIFLTRGAVTCGGCHTPPMFITSAPQAPFALLDPTDLGINNQGRFKSSTLRNIVQTAPYFHNGSVISLNAMLASNIPAHGVPPQDRAPILAFLNTLTDNTITTDPKFSNPFK